MSVLSVDLAYKRYSDVGCVILENSSAGIACSPVRLSTPGVPDPEVLAGALDETATNAGLGVILLDGPQGWKSAISDLMHSRRCERELNTPAKTGLPGSVKPGIYLGFVAFSIGVFDALASRGWRRLDRFDGPVQPGERLLVESFPLSAWRSLKVPALPAKAKTRPEHLERSMAALCKTFPIDVSFEPTHDELQAVVAGVAGLAVERSDWESCIVSGVPPSFEDGYWREGFIVNACKVADVVAV